MPMHSNFPQVQATHRMHVHTSLLAPICTILSLRSEEMCALTRTAGADDPSRLGLATALTCDRGCFRRYRPAPRYHHTLRLPRPPPPLGEPRRWVPPAGCVGPGAGGVGGGGVEEEGGRRKEGGRGGG
eukprot:2662811-Rhodomonas_salina.1